MNICIKCNNPIEMEAIYGLHADCFAKEFDLENVREFKDLDPKKSSAIHSKPPEIKKHKDTFFHGVYQKYSARLGPTEYILKVQESRFPELPLVEYLCNQIAVLLKIEVPPHHLINFNGHLAFVTRNFMQDYTGTLHHIYKFLSAGNENHSCEEIIKVILNQTGKLSEVAKFIEICLFDALIGNNDRHGRNIGIIETTTLKKLAPMYDNPSCLGIEDVFFLMADINPSGQIWTAHSREPTPVDYIQEFQRLDYGIIVKKFCSNAVLQFSNIFNLINNTQISQIRKDAFMKLLEKRIGAFANVQ